MSTFLEIKLIRSTANNVFIRHNPEGIKFITRIKLVLSHLQEHKFRHSFQNILKPICNCGSDIESSLHYLPHCPTYNTEKHILLSTLKNIDSNLLDFVEPILIETLLFDGNSFDINTNTNVLNAAIEHILSTKRFDTGFFQ